MKSTGIKKYLIILTMISLLIFLYFLGLLTPVEQTIATLLNPLISKAQGLSSGVRKSYREQSEKRDLSKVIEELEDSNRKLMKENAELKVMAEENAELKDYLDFFTESNFEYRMANVISRGDITDISGRTETVTLDKGSDNGVLAGAAVVNGQGVIIGKISEVKPKISKAHLTNSGKCKLAAALLNGQKTAGITQGELGLTIKMEFIPQNASVNAGDTVVTSGLEELIPRGLVIGRVINTVKESNELWQTAVIEPVSDPDNLIMAAVIIPK